MWMEFVRGRSLADLVEEHGAFGAPEASLIGLDLCRALAAVHEAGLLHRDVKAQNVMRETGGRLLLMDFGAADDLRLSIDGIGASGRGDTIAAVSYGMTGAAVSVWTRQ